ncbi:MAG: zinc-dependent peptidase [Nitrosomonas sp.]|nr:zinc-dependent peptidase [Nitrosomonas sp.]
MFWYLEKWRRRWILKRKFISEPVWRAVVDQLPFLQGLTAEECTRLREWVTLFLHDKKINGVQGLVMTEAMGVMIAVQACLLILNLDLEYYDDWAEVIVYPSRFVLNHIVTDETGVVHTRRLVASGESWQTGPVVLSWEDVASAGHEHGYNVVIHEFAHKLDMLNGSANGYPPLHSGMDPREWADVFTAAYENFCTQLARGESPVMTSYAAENPAEFFAVLSEVFFVQPQRIKFHFPGVYQQLARYYRQDPAARLEKI